MGKCTKRIIFSVPSQIDHNVNLIVSCKLSDCICIEAMDISPGVRIHGLVAFGDCIYLISIVIEKDLKFFMVMVSKKVLCKITGRVFSKIARNISYF